MDGYPFWTTGRIRNDREFEEGSICVMGGMERSDLKFIPKVIFVNLILSQYIMKMKIHDYIMHALACS